MTRRNSKLKSNELDEIRYYLDHAKNAPRAINLAIIGGRASGKTSLLNMIQREAEKRSFSTVRLELDESDGVSQLSFFGKLFDSLLTKACENGAFEGIHGKTYYAYRDMADAYLIPEDKTFCPFIFPVQYAKAMGSQNFSINISDNVFKRDIQIIQNAVNKPIAILIDECDVLGKSRVHIEKLRNIFRNSSGFMLVLTGTEALFPLINDVFSPIIRQFKKINVKPFNSPRETRDCIIKPLENLGVNPFEVIDIETLLDVSAVHNLSGGRPYEIQLICHLLFRKVQTGRAKRLELTSDVLDDVIRELQSSQDTSIRPIVNKIRNLNLDQLNALAVLCACNGRADVDQIWFAHYLIVGFQNWTREKLQDYLKDLEDMGLITTKDNVIKFEGDEFDRIYGKYYSRKHDVQSSIENLPYELHLLFNLGAYVTDQLDYLETVEGTEPDTTNLHAIDDLILSLQTDKDFNPFDTDKAQLAEFIYETSLAFIQCAFYQIVSITLISPWNRVSRWYTVQITECGETRSIDEINQSLSDISKRSAELKGKIEIHIYKIPVFPIETLAQKILASKNDSLKKEMFDIHMSKMSEFYIEENDPDSALFHGKLALMYKELPDKEVDANNLGYLFMASNEFEIAQRLFEFAIGAKNNIPITALAKYNLGILNARMQNFDKATLLLKEAKADAQKMDLGDQWCACLYIAETANSLLEFKEVQNPNLVEATDKSLLSLEGYIFTSSNM